MAQVPGMAQPLAEHGQRLREAGRKRVSYVQQAQTGLCSVEWSPHVESIQVLDYVTAHLLSALATAS